MLKTDATPTFAAAEHTACSSMDTFSYRQMHFSFRFGSQFVTLFPKKTNIDAYYGALSTFQMKLMQVILLGANCYLILSKIKFLSKFSSRYVSCGQAAEGGPL